MQLKHPLSPGINLKTTLVLNALAKKGPCHPIPEFSDLNSMLLLMMSQKKNNL